jgi:hypothetical protein
MTICENEFISKVFYCSNWMVTFASSHCNRVLNHNKYVPMKVAWNKINKPFPFKKQKIILCTPNSPKKSSDTHKDQFSFTIPETSQPIPKHMRYGPRRG